MQPWQILLFIFAGLNLVLFITSYFQCRNKNAYGLTKYLFFLGMFVWGDVFIFSIFWTFVALLCIMTGNIYLFFTFVSLFWVVRSVGETVYWLNQQFSQVKREPPEKVELYSLVKNDAVWFMQQIKNQCISVIALVSSIYFITLWIQSL